MGAWGVGHFANDDALDWVYELEEAKNFEPVEDAINAVEASSDYLEAPEACFALAAAETIAAALGKPAADLPDSVSVLIDDLGRPSDALVGRASAAIKKLAGESELQELWKETDDYGEWQSKVSDLLQRLE